MGIMKIIHHFYHNGQPSIPDHVVMSLYDRMMEDGTAKTVFDDGSIQDRESFLEAMENGCRLHVVVDGDQPVAAIWLNRFEGKMARLHFCFFKEAWGARSAGVGRFAITELLNMKFEDEYVYDCFTGFIPDKNKAARMFFQKIGVGVRTVGHLPLGHWNNEEGKSEPCTIVYIDRGCMNEGL